MARSFLLLCIGGLIAITCSSRADEPKLRVLLIGKDRDHPPRSHEYMSECGLLAKCLRQTPGVETLVSDGWPKDSKLLEGVNVVVLYTAMGGNVLSAPACRAEVERLLDRGVGLVAIHWSTGADDGASGEWQLDHLGGWFGFSFSKIPIVDSRVHQVEKSHPICRGWADFDMRDEYYTDLKYHRDAKPLLTAVVEGKRVPIAWTFERLGAARGRSFGTVCGHFHDCFAIESFRRMLANAVLWAGGRDVPATGTPCRASAEDLVLPPDARDSRK